MVRHLMMSWHLNIWKFKIWLSQEWKELSKWNKKHFSLFHGSSLLDIQSKNVVNTIFKGHIKIFALTLYYEIHYPENHYHHNINNDIGIAKISFFPYKFYLEKIEHLYLTHLVCYMKLFTLFETCCLTQ